MFLESVGDSGRGSHTGFCCIVFLGSSLKNGGRKGGEGGRKEGKGILLSVHPLFFRVEVTYSRSMLQR